MRHKTAFLVFVLSSAACGVSGSSSDSITNDPDWKSFRSTATNGGDFAGDVNYRPRPGSFLFRDLKNESDASLATRLLGEVGRRIVHIDRNRDRWQYYSSDDDPVESIALYSKPESWGSAYGICRSEKYEISFSGDGRIESVEVSPRYGVEGPIFQKYNFDWDFFRGRMCETVPGSHTPSYFPAENVLEAQDLAILLAKAIDLAGKNGKLSYNLTCQTYSGEACRPDIRAYLGKLSLKEIEKTSEITCPYAKGPGENCFTVTVGKGRLGPFPKMITIKGSTYMNDWKVHSVEVSEGFTVS
jgi:hypothetical protein